jgi:hypothetical protein
MFVLKAIHIPYGVTEGDIDIVDAESPAKRRLNKHDQTVYRS